MKTLDVLAVGSCYVDTNLPDYPFSDTGITTEVELVGGQYEIVAGGSAVNFCRQLAELGLKTAFVGLAGLDAHGDILESLLKQDGVKSFVVRRPDISTNISFGMTNPSGKHIVLVAGTASAALSPATVIPQLEKTVSQAKMFFMGGCFKLKALAPSFAQMAEIARKNNVAIAVDHNRIPEGTDDAMLETVRQLVLKAKYYLPSRCEFCQLWNVGSIEEGLRLLHQKAAGLNVIVKDSANGAYYWDGSLQQSKPTHVEKVVHLTGAGDYFNAGVIAAISNGKSIAQAAAYGCAVAAAKITGQPVPRS